MKITVGQLKKLIAEAYMSRDDIVAMLADTDSDEVATEDYIDDETGEVMWEEGEAAGESSYHPDAEIRRADKKRREDEEYEEWEREEREYELDSYKEREDAEKKLFALVDDYVEGAAGILPDMLPSGYSSEEARQMASDIAPDLSMNFFSVHPEWKRLADTIEMSKMDVASRIQDLIYDAMLSEI